MGIKYLKPQTFFKTYFLSFLSYTCKRATGSALS